MFFKGLIFSFLFYSPFLFASALINPNHWQDSISRCGQSYENSEELFLNEFRWNYTLLEMQDQFLKTYQSGKRLGLHANYDYKNQSFVIYSKMVNKTFPIKINQSFIRSITLQIETALKKGYASFVFFPDMGHTHLYFKKEQWEKNYHALTLKIGDQPLLYEKMFSDPQLMPLYHLSEQLKLKDNEGILINDETISFKFWTRNFMARNDETDFYTLPIDMNHPTNTVDKIEGLNRYGQGFAVSASEKGCFPYQDSDGEIRYFDIALYEPRSDPSNPDPSEIYLHKHPSN